MIKLFFRKIQSELKKAFFIIACTFLFFFTACNANREFLSQDLQEQMSRKRTVQNTDDREELQITLNTPKPKKKRKYYWFRFGDIHITSSNYSGYLLDGTYNKFNNNFGLLEKGIFHEGLKTGNWIAWYTNGSEATNTRYKNGFKQGVFKSYDSIGNVTKKGHYKKGLKTGKWYDNEGVLTKVRYKKGIKQGVFVSYNSIGEIIEKGHYQKGLKTGKWYENEGGLTKTGYKKGIKQGVFISYDSIGGILEQGHYKKGLKTGEWIHLVNKDTVYYKVGKIIPRDSIKAKSPFVNRLYKKVFRKKGEVDLKDNKTRHGKATFKNESKKKSIVNKRIGTKSKNTKKRSKPKQEDGFFKRLYKRIFKKKKKGKK